MPIISEIKGSRMLVRTGLTRIEDTRLYQALPTDNPLDSFASSDKVLLSPQFTQTEGSGEQIALGIGAPSPDAGLASEGVRVKRHSPRPMPGKESTASLIDVFFSNGPDDGTFASKKVIWTSTGQTSTETVAHETNPDGTNGRLIPGGASRIVGGERIIATMNGVEIRDVFNNLQERVNNGTFRLWGVGQVLYSHYEEKSIVMGSDAVAGTGGKSVVSLIFLANPGGWKHRVPITGLVSNVQTVTGFQEYNIYREANLAQLFLNTGFDPGALV